MPLDKVIDGMKTHMGNVRIHHERATKRNGYAKLHPFRTNFAQPGSAASRSGRACDPPPIAQVETTGLIKLTVLSEADCTAMREAYGRCSALLHSQPGEINPRLPAPSVIEAKSTHRKSGSPMFGRGRRRPHDHTLCCAVSHRGSALMVKRSELAHFHDYKGRCNPLSNSGFVAPSEPHAVRSTVRSGPSLVETRGHRRSRRARFRKTDRNLSARRESALISGFRFDWPSGRSFAQPRPVTTVDAVSANVRKVSTAEFVRLYLCHVLKACWCWSSFW